jgi:hypothetical protein
MVMKTPRVQEAKKEKPLLEEFKHLGKPKKQGK